MLVGGFEVSSEKGDPVLAQVGSCGLYVLKSRQ